MRARQGAAGAAPRGKAVAPSGPWQWDLACALQALQDQGAFGEDQPKGGLLAAWWLSLRRSVLHTRTEACREAVFLCPRFGEQVSAHRHTLGCFAPGMPHALLQQFHAGHEAGAARRAAPRRHRCAVSGLPDPPPCKGVPRWWGQLPLRSHRAPWRSARPRSNRPAVEKAPCAALAHRRCASGSAPLALTSPSEKLVCMSFTFGRFSSTSRANCEKLSRSRATTCSSKVPVPLM